MPSLIKKSPLTSSLGAVAVAVAAALVPTLLVAQQAQAQNVAIVNGKPVPKSRVETLMTQITRQGQPRTPELETQVRDEVVMREIFAQEAEKLGLQATPDFRAQMELARQALLIRELFNNYQQKNKPSEAEVKAEYDRVKAQQAGTEYHARHILVEKEEDAKALITQLKGGANFEELAKKNSKDPGSGENGGDLDWAGAGSYVSEFGEALKKLKKGEMTDTPVKTQFGWHIIRLEDTREARFPTLDEVRPQIEQRLTQLKVAKLREDIRARTRTDYKFSDRPQQQQQQQQQQ